MKHHIFSRALSLTAAAVMSWSVAGGSGVLQTAAAQTPPASPASPESPVQSKDSNEIVTVIVKVTGDAVMEQPEALEMGSDFLETDLAMQLTAQCKAIQQSVQDRIRQFYPGLQVGYSYSALYNGFSCELPENLVEQVKALPDVTGVAVMEDIAAPQMNRAAALSGFPAYYDYTGCAGEGQVIAVIDSELDITHPMFAPLADGIETAVSKEDVAEVINSGILNRSADADRAYISNKLPFVLNYTNNDDPYSGISDEFQYHGTHVSGIAAGNEFETDDGTTFSGIAKDAQLMFFGVSTEEGYIDGDAGLAAIEDAVKLHADVINMSWGADGVEYWGTNPFSEAISAADRAGVIVCNAAGNADNGTYSWGEITVPENPDTCYMGDKAELGSPIMMVASADNTGISKGGAFLFGEKQVVLMPKLDYYGNLIYLSDCLAPGEYEYVDCANGTSRDFDRAGDLSGRIALVQRSDVTTLEITYNANNAGASGVLLIDQEHPDGMDYIFSDSSVIINGISWLDGQALLEAENKILTITSEPIEREFASKVSSYTAWGVKQSLDLRPDIMGIGGRVRSAAYYSGDYTASGTSMASPYVAGCSAVLREYLKKLGVEMTGSDFAAYVRRLMMNTATPYEESGNFVTPRRQGAGLVTLDKAMAAKVLMTGDAGDAKVNLFDLLGDNFSFDLTLTNYSDEDVTFPQAEIRLTTDGTYYDTQLELDRTSGQQKLNCSTDFNGPVTIAAGESKTVTVSISLDAAQCRKLEEKFKYGFFAEGYIMLSGAENSADISIPMLGYHGDWAQIPISDPETDSIMIMFGAENYSTPLSVVKTGLLYKQILERVPEKEIHKEMEFALFKEFLFAYSYGTKEEKKQLASNSMECWLSPNNDRIADALEGFRYDNYRRTHAESGESILYDPDGNILYQGPSGAVSNEVDFEKLEEGDYKYRQERRINYPRSIENPQIQEATVHIDKTAPTVNYDYIEENGRNYLVITAADDRQLQGLTVSGTGNGGEAGVYQPGNDKDDLRKRCFAYSFYQRGLNRGSSFKDYGNVPSLPFVLRSWGHIAEDTEGENYDFADVLAAEPDEKGIWKVKYDITDLKNYSVTILDEAYNFVEIRSTGNAAEELTAQKGFWAEPDHGYFMIGDNTFTYTSYWDGSVTEYSYTAEGDKLTLTSGNETTEYSVWPLSDTNYQLKNQDDNTVIDLSRSENVRDRYEGKNLIPIKPILDEALTRSNETHDVEMVITHYSLVDGFLCIIINNANESDDFTQDYIMLNIFNGRGTISSTGEVWSYTVWYCQEYLSEIPAGLYSILGDPAVLLFNDDGETGTILSNGINTEFSVIEPTPFTYTIGENGSITFSFGIYTLNGSVMRNLDNDSVYIHLWGNDNHSSVDLNMELITDDMAKISNMRSLDEMAQLATAYINAVLGTDYTPDTKQTGWFGYQLGFSWNSYYIHIDPLTLDVTDEEGNTGNLLNPPKMPENAAYTLDELKDMAAAMTKDRTGTIAEYVQSILRYDGSVMIKLRDCNGGLIDIYMADPVTGNIAPKQNHRGDVNCDGDIDVADAVLLARVLTEDTSAVITAEGRNNADCDLDNTINSYDVVCILRYIARIIRF